MVWFIFSIIKTRLKNKRDLNQAIDRVLLLVKVPKTTGRKEEEIRDSKELAILFAGVQDQFFASLSSTFQKDFRYKFLGQEHFTFEIATTDEQITFYVSCPAHQVSLMEKQIHGFYPEASIEPVENYNIFSEQEGSQVACTVLTLANEFTFPIRTYRYLETDSLSSITNVLSKLGANSTAAIQIAIRPTDNSWRKTCETLAKNIQEGKKIKEGFGSKIFEFSKDLGKAAFQKSPSPDAKLAESHKLTPMEEQKVRALEEKSAKPGFETQIRIITCAPNLPSAEAHLGNIVSSFAQFSAPELNHFKPARIKSKSRVLADFIFRRFGESKTAMILNTEELASLFHFPNKNIETPNIRWLAARDAPPPANLPTEGTLIGESIYRGEKKLVFIKPDDRRRHLYAIGKTGTGKTTLFVNMILADILAGEGVCYIDPHGDAIESILPRIPKERAEDVILFDPADTQRPFGLNLLEWKTTEQKDFLVQEAVQIFYKLFDPEHVGIVGPQFEHWMRNAALTVMSDPQGGTIIEIPRLFTDRDFERAKIKYVTDPIVLNFWNKQMAQTAEFHKSEMLNYFTSKFGRFMTNEMMRNIIGQAQSSFNFREVMDQGKILLVNLSKGKIGDVNSNLLGMILVAKLQAAAMSRADVPENQRRDFYLYVDEFQNFATENFAQILSEARKYHLCLNITNQYVAQLEEKIRDAVFGNVGTLISYRIGAQDAEFVEKEFSPVFTAEDLLNVDKFHAYIKLLIDGVASKPFSMHVLQTQIPENPQIGEAIRQLSRYKFGKDKAQVEYQIQERAKIIPQEVAETSEPPIAPDREGRI